MLREGLKCEKVFENLIWLRRYDFLKIAKNLIFNISLVDYANTTNVEFIVDPKVYSMVDLFTAICKYLIKCKWLPGEGADWFLDNIMTWSYCLHRRYSMSWQKDSISTNEHALNREPVRLRWFPRVFTNNPSYLTYVTEGNLVTLSLRFCSWNSPLRLPI